MSDKMYETLRKYSVLTFALLIAAFSFNLFLKPINLAAGGNNGLAIILSHILGISPSLCILGLYVILLMFSFIFLGYKDTVAALYITIVYPFFVEITGAITPYFGLDTNNILLITLFAGFVGGITNGMIYKLDFNTGGIGIISKILFKYKKVSISEINMIINIVIVIVGGFIFGYSMILYALIYLFVSKVVSENLMLGVSKNKVFYIISDDYLNIRKFIMEELKHDVTIYDTLGKYTGGKKKMLMTVVSNNDYFVLKEVLENFDSKPFVFVSDSYGVNGLDLSIKGIK